MKEQNKDPVKEFKELKDLTDMDGKKRYLIGYFEDKNSLEYANFRKAAMNLKDDCLFHAGFGEVTFLLLSSKWLGFKPLKSTKFPLDLWLTHQISDGKANASSWSVNCCF